jgi:cysteine desulfurase
LIRGFDIGPLGVHTDTSVQQPIPGSEREHALHFVEAFSDTNDSLDADCGGPLEDRIEVGNEGIIREMCVTVDHSRCFQLNRKRWMNKMYERIYLDYNATTPLSEAARTAMERAATTIWGNPSSVHAEGQASRAAVERARAQVAELVGAQARSIVFTSGATESINTVHRLGPGIIVTTNVEHPATLGACGDDAVLMKVDPIGQLDLEALDQILSTRSDVALVSVMLANNETGNLYPIADVAELCRAHGVVCHTDATQAVGRVPLDLAELGVDLASFSSHKMYGPMGVGALYVRSPFELPPLLLGGHQERGQRPGTENLPAIIGFGAAAAAAGELAHEVSRQASLRNALLDRLEGEPLVVNGDPRNGLPNTLNVSFLGCEAETLLIALDLEGVSVSAGSACSAGSLEPSHVIVALTDDPDRQRSAVRFSLGRGTTAADIEQAADRALACVRRIRNIPVPSTER